MSDPDNRPPELPRVRRGTPRRFLLGVAAALLVAGGAGAATAAASAGHGQPVAVAAAQPSPGPSEPGGTPGEGGGQGGYQTFTSQTGTVSAVSDTSITVSGDNGPARTYTVDDNTRVVAGPRGLTGVNTGDSVWVVGTAEGGTPRAVLIVDVTRPALPGHGGGGPGGPGGQPTAPTAPPPGPEGSPVPSGPESSPETVPPTG
ncbi:hypothetical protein GCM10009530_15370 [Microbispora corallina]|uniref:DUF5666 domain-containing protein n=1 Tax=Microbispora corallina TaxID=83302 RepID=A0ABQ4FXK7_9ACTN|nr:hypothetical protein [Microbispora corallina]GIH39495.1 hypothetical protein Mco01_24950 [Microbispora corallina]